MFDVVIGLRMINQTLRQNGFRARDADTSDFQFGTDPGLRFKTGTSYGEVAITIWHHSRQVDVIRCLNDRQIAEAKKTIGELCNAFHEKRRV